MKIQSSSRLHQPRPLLGRAAPAQKAKPRRARPLACPDRVRPSSMPETKTKKKTSTARRKFRSRVSAEAGLGSIEDVEP